MRTPSDMPRRLPRASRRSRIIAAVVVVVLVVLIASLSGIAHFWTDYLWFQSVGFTSVFRGVLVTKIFLAVVFVAIFFVLMWVNLIVADRHAPFDTTLAEQDELVSRYRDLVMPRGRVVRAVTALIFALLAGIGANREWNNWDLLRYHINFGVKDPQFHKDVGFYVFELPFIKFLIGWTFEALAVVLVVTAVAHYLNGGIHLQGSERRVTAAVKTHLSVLLGALAVVKGIDYYFQRFELVLSRNHVVNGATATNVHADLPARTLLIAIAAIAAALFLINIRQRGWTLPAVAVALWLLVYVLVGAAYPALYQALRVSPSESTKEQPYIQRNINATRAAYGLDNVKTDDNYNYSPTVTQSEVQGTSPQQLANQQTLANVRLLDPSVNLKNTFDKYQAQRAYYQFNDLDLDRYPLATAGSGTPQLTATVAAVRELNSAASVLSGFVNKHLGYTHGYGAVLAPIGQAGVNPDGTPNFSLSELPPAGQPPLSANGSEIYYGIGNDTSGYVIAASKTQELDYESNNGAQVTTSYTGKGGVDAGSIIRRAAFALRFRDANFILSGQINPSSKVMYIRNINDRVRKAAPFLKYDSDPYAVILDNQVYWVIDAYTTTDNYPYSQNAITDRVTGSDLDSTFNYVRNSVKVVVSAYDGSMHFFVTKTDDPIIRVYERAFPDLFTPIDRADSIIPGIVAHFRYPEDIFKVQTNMFGRYHLTSAKDFYTQAQAWAVSPDPGSGQLTQSSQIGQSVLGSNGQLGPPPVARLQPQYLLAHLPGSTQQSFMLMTPYVPLSTSTERQNLTAFMTASSDPNDYGTLRLFVTPAGQNVDGPALIANAIRSNISISTELSFLNQNGSTVELGEVVIVPIDQTLVYVQPVYVESSSNQVPTLKDVIVVYNSIAYHSSNASLDNALCQVANPDGSQPFSNYCNTTAANATPLVPSGTGGTGTPGSPSTTVPSNGAPTVASLLAQAQAALNAANTALKNGDLATYQADVNKALGYLNQAEQLEKPGGK